MKAIFAALRGQIRIEVESPSVKELFERVAEVQEIFGADSVCGNCESPNVHFRMRTVDKYKYYEMHCVECHAALSFGQKQDGVSLFPKRREEDGSAMRCRGWIRFIKPAEQRES